MRTNLSDVVLPGQTIGIVGGGQLGQMLSFAAKQMGYQVGILDPTANCPAGQVSDFQIIADYDDHDALIELAKKSDVLTYEFENVDVTTLKEAAKYTKLPQGTKVLEITSNRISEKEFLEENKIPVTRFRAITALTELEMAIAEFGYGCILKTASGGYDGHGQLNIDGHFNLEAAEELLKHGECILEEKQQFIKELSVMVTRSAAGEVQVFPVAENIHRHHILNESIVPARVEDDTKKLADEIATKIANALKLRGVLGIEFFMLADGQLMVNELAPRPHNSGHYTIEACNISQFEAHIRSICGLVIPKIYLYQPAVMVNVLGQHLQATHELLPIRPMWHYHDYGKSECKLDRKMGHITILSDDMSSVLAQIKSEKIWEI
ncbi:phosphoribosylaminoimidazole carboxylase ATPase subunit [Paucilactobacillus oligofermentans DSM 15707 = LMG 22743]|uniref:N5-carboxyaminoimidazole ribonucleotide synthase n=1 Tax=Paucilactobacillus oligofermentans DSM 15707 = LMG 22743 TaxID=1423778 RepID=A0A0R1RER4_9LACO|nr:5-(carboxyamino)imidazole ribonucleotide synthase [Paucilactobacillus oligofermentans]KRL55407.1 phosphoribosylaminoimidazole carboxylase ATPase subunit [Paucilactobacillus oligofermentans DSM 15707 = LMG 22743]CUS25603.1 Phosphoribosylaminoimidazole carboxylase ATPase subunit PurK [Paucilactobacillus oligofermentans DSM 15707 = LMG 22743]